MTGSPRPMLAVVLRLTIRLSLSRRQPRRRFTVTPLPKASNGTRGGRTGAADPYWTVSQLSAEMGVPAVVVARAARELGFGDLVFDDEEAAAIIDLLNGGPPPRSA